MVIGWVARSHPVDVVARELQLGTGRVERGDRPKPMSRDVRADVEGHAGQDEHGADDAQGALPHGAGGGAPPRTSRARWYSSAVMSPLANLRARMSCGVSAMAG